MDGEKEKEEEEEEEGEVTSVRGKEPLLPLILLSQTTWLVVMDNPKRSDPF